MTRIGRQNLLGILTVILIGGGMALFRQLFIVPRATVGLCAAATGAPSYCAPRAAVQWLQYQQAFGWAALVLGVIGFCTGHRWAGILAVAVGVAATVNYNATTGIIGASLGLLAWIGLETGRYARKAA